MGRSDKYNPREVDLLQDYLDSYCSRLPTDYIRFKVGHDYEELCVFCGNEHSDKPVYIRDAITGKTVENSGTKACATCNFDVDNFIFQQWEAHDGPNTDPHHGFQHKINLLRFIQFDPEVDSYYSHLNPVVDIYVDQKRHSACYLCDSKLETRDKIRSINVPTDYAQSVSGGWVSLCPRCSNEYSSEIDSIFVNNTYSGNLKVEQCPACRTKYYITKREQEFRETYLTGLQVDMEWLCPECAYARIDNFGGDHPLWIEENHASRILPMKRFSIKECLCCLSQFEVDLTLSDYSYHLKHCVKSKFICKVCVGHAMKAVLTANNTILTGDRRLIILTGTNSFEVHKLETSPPFMRKLESKIVDTESFLDTICVAWETYGK